MAKHIHSLASLKLCMRNSAIRVLNAL